METKGLAYVGQDLSDDEESILNIRLLRKYQHWLEGGLGGV